tara:strand:+ start:125 stop:340 length:216 start_codon:yes stop_codon:yes gene_type:complete
MTRGNIFKEKKEFPKTVSCANKNHGKRGGFEKYPRLGDCDHNQYCASSPYKPKPVKYTATILKRTSINKDK